MRTAWIRSEVLIAVITTICIAAWVGDRVVPSPIAPHPATSSVEQDRPLPPKASWYQVEPDRTPVESGLTAWEEDDSREELRESIRSSTDAGRDRPLLKRSIQAPFVLDDETPSKTPGGRRGPPPRMPPA